MTLLSPDDAAELTGIAKGTLKNWRSAGKGPPCYKLGRKMCYGLEELTAWIETHRYEPENTERSPEFGTLHLPLDWSILVQT